MDLGIVEMLFDPASTLKVVHKPRIPSVPAILVVPRIHHLLANLDIGEKDVFVVNHGSDLIDEGYPSAKGGRQVQASQLGGKVRLEALLQWVAEAGGELGGECSELIDIPSTSVCIMSSDKRPERTTMCPLDPARSPNCMTAPPFHQDPQDSGPAETPVISSCPIASRQG